MKRIVLINQSHEEARIEAEERYINDRTIDPESLKTDLKYMADLLKESSPEETLPGETKLEPTLGVDDLKANFHKLSREGQDSILRQLDDVKARNLKVSKEEGFKKLPADMQATLGISADNLKKLTEDQRTTLTKKFDDILTVEREAKKKQILKEFTKK